MNHKVSLIRNIFQHQAQGSSKEDSCKNRLQQIKTNISNLATHQSWLSRKVGFSLPKSLQIVVCQLAREFNIPLTEHSLAKVAYIMLSLQEDNSSIGIEDAIKYLNNLRENKNDLQYSRKSSSNQAINQVYKVVDFIIRSSGTGHFADVIAESKHGLYKNSHYSEYKTNNFFNNEVALFGANHFSFWSSKTHTISGLMGLSRAEQYYNYASYTYGIRNALSALGVRDTPDMSNIKVNNEDECPEDVDSFELCLENKLYPTAQSSQKQMLNFFKKENRGISFSTDGVDYMIKPKLIHDVSNNHYYVNWEFGRKTAFASIHKNYMLHFNGNATSQRDAFDTAGNLVKLLPNTIQVLVDYPNKGINHILNPKLSAYKTSIKGSINPHIATYNHYIQSKEQFNLHLYAHSYGNLAAAQFINTILDQDKGREIFMIGSATASSLYKVAESFKPTLTGIANYFKLTNSLINSSDVLTALKKPQVKSLIFGNQTDPIIQRSAQITNEIKDLPDNIYCVDNIVKIEGEDGEAYYQHSEFFGNSVTLWREDGSKTKQNFNELFKNKFDSLCNRYEDLRSAMNHEFKNQLQHKIE